MDTVPWQPAIPSNPASETSEGESKEEVMSLRNFDSKWTC